MAAARRWRRKRPGGMKRSASACSTSAPRRTPRYVYHLPTVRHQARAAEVSRAVDRWHYAVKANTHPAFLRNRGEEGFGFECVSPGELKAVLAAVPETAPMLFTPNFAPREDYALVAAHPCHRVAGFAASARALGRTVPRPGDRVARRSGSWPGSSRQGSHRRRPAAIRSSAGCRSNLSAPGRCARCRSCAACMRTLARAFLMATHWGEVYAQLASLAERIGSVAFSISAAASACPRIRARRGWTSPRSIARCARSRRRIRTTSCGWSPAAIWWPTPACCWRASPS